MLEQAHAIDDNWILAPLSGRIAAFEFAAVFVQHFAEGRHPAHLKLFASTFEGAGKVSRESGFYLLSGESFHCPAAFYHATDLLPGLAKDLGLCAFEHWNETS